MNRTLFNNPFLLGFEEIERLVERTAKAGGYPPYNVEHDGDELLRITLAVAGFTVNDLTVAVEGNQLVIRGRQNEGPGKTYLHRGIAGRQFEKIFVLAQSLDVLRAELDRGLLVIELRRTRLEPAVRTIPIRSGAVQTADRIVRA